MNREIFADMKNQMNPSQAAIDALYSKIKSRRPKISFGRVSIAAALLILIISIPLASYFSRNSPGQPSPPPIGGSADMLALVVLDGKTYTQAEYLECDEETMESLKGEYLGRASGTIDEWSSKKEYDKNFASNITGDVYTVNGYDKNFRICIPHSGEDGTFLLFFENLDEITLSNGYNLYGTYLHLKENFSGVYYQLHDDWNYSEKNLKEIDTHVIKYFIQFIDSLYTSPFVIPPRNVNDDIGIQWDNPRQVHVYFLMKDGTTIELRLFENGYVYYQNMHGNYFVNMESEIFNQVFNLCFE